MKQTIFHIAERIAAWLTGSASDQEMQELEAWKRGKVGREKLLEELATPEEFADNQQQLGRFSAQEAWKKMQGRLEEKNTGTARWRGGWKYAAAILLLLGVGGWYFVVNRPVPVEVTVIAKAIPSGSQGARLTLGNGKVVDVTPDNQFTLAEMDGTMIRKDASGIGYRPADKTGDTLVYNRMETLTGMEYTLTLADGTLVYLNAESSLKFPVAFRGHQRVVELVGEAYFKVAKDAQHPFVVKMSGVELKVVGTSFNARSYADEPQVVATLVEGRIEVNGRQITPGQQMTFTRTTGKLAVANVDTEQYTAWQQGRFVFRNERLEDVMRTLARWYGVEYHFVDEASKDIRLGARFARYDSMSPIIDMLRKTELVEVLQTNRSLYISVKK